MGVYTRMMIGTGAQAWWLPPVMMRTPITVSAVESVGTVEPEPRPVTAIARVDDDANRRRRSVAMAWRAFCPQAKGTLRNLHLSFSRLE